ncbi:MAG: hypothetical protein QM308_03195 [Bacillota bacterium]|nr:hypothetical protein [Bacillota bacterium]
MNTLSFKGRQMVFWGAVLLFGWAVYELSVRFDEMLIWLAPVNSLVQDGKISWLDYLQRVNWGKLQTHLFLLVCAIFSLYALLVRKNRIMILLNVPIAILLVVFSLGRTPLLSASIWQKLKLIPLVLIIFGSGLMVFANIQKKRAPKTENGGSVRRQHYDPFRINRE